MSTAKVITGNAESIWKELQADLNENPLGYQAEINLEGRNIFFSIYTSLDSGLDSAIPMSTIEPPFINGNYMAGYSETYLSPDINTNLEDFTFAIHHENFIDKIGKFLGMTDVVLGYPEFDKNLIVKTNNKEKLSKIFTSGDTRKIFSNLYEFKLYISHNDEKEHHSTLEFESSPAIRNINDLRKIIDAYIVVLNNIESSKL
jgi:hypothetical protein